LARTVRERHPRAVQELDLLWRCGGHRIDQLPAGTQLELPNLGDEAVWRPPALDPPRCCPKIPDRRRLGVVDALEAGRALGCGLRRTPHRMLYFCCDRLDDALWEGHLC